MPRQSSVGSWAVSGPWDRLIPSSNPELPTLAGPRQASQGCAFLIYVVTGASLYNSSEGVWQ